MGFEHLKYDFPKMPDEIRTMIEAEVARQVKIEKPSFRSRKAAGRMLVASLVAAMLCGATVFAGVGLYRMQQQKIGEHGVSINIESSQEKENTSIVIPDVKMEASYLPEGMVETGTGRYSFLDAKDKGGVTITFYRMDTGDDAFEVKHGDVVSSEEFTAGGYQGIYQEYSKLYQDEITFNQRIYVAYTDVHYVMEMYVASDVSKEEALKIAENIKLIPTDSTDDKLVIASNWSSYQEGADKEAEGYECKTITSVAKEEFKNIYAVGDSFLINEEGLSANVSEVKILDDIQLLDAAYVEEELKKEVDDNQKLRPATIQYIKDGDTDTLSQKIHSREVAQKLVYATVEYTNTSEKEMTDVLIFGALPRIREVDGQMQIVAEEQPKAKDQWNRVVNQGLSDMREMIYYDVRGGERENNYLKNIQPGETKVVHMAWVVTEEELSDLYISLDTSSGGYEFSESSLKTGYVDIRQ